IRQFLQSRQHRRVEWAREPDSRYNTRSLESERLLISATTASVKTGSDNVSFRQPTKQDGAAIAQIVRDTGVLDSNSVYAYLLIGEHFGDTSVVAELDGRIAGFISAYCPPAQPDTIFVWQVGVTAAGRGRRIATRMLFEIVRRTASAHVRYLDTTISPDNVPSMALFRGFARKLDTE